MSAAPVIHAVLTGSLAPLGEYGVPSGIFKQPVDRRIAVTRTGFTDDVQGDETHHGGPEKAIHHYPFEHYAAWAADFPALATHLGRAGSFGENISTEGMTETNVCIGDVYRFGTAVLEVSQARQPCWKLNERFGMKSMARRVQESGRTGWYYRVRQVGRIGPGDRIELLDRPVGNWPLERILNAFYRDPLNVGELMQLASLAPLTESWRDLARRRLQRQAVEDWARRLNTPEPSRSRGGSDHQPYNPRKGVPS